VAVHNVYKWKIIDTFVLSSKLSTRGNIKLEPVNANASQFLSGEIN